MINRVHCLLLKELAQLRRDRRLFGMLLISPLVQLLLLGFAANTDVREIAMAVRDNDRSFYSREFVRAVAASGYFKTKTLTGPESQDGSLLVSGKEGLILVIPPEFSERLLKGQPSPVQALVDGADSNFAVQGVNYLRKAARVFSERLGPVNIAQRTRESGPRPLPAVVAESRVWYNPDLESRRFMVPAIMAQVLMVTTMLVTSMALVKEREDGTLEQLIVTPLRPIEMVLGKLLPFVIVGFAEIIFALLLIWLAFGFTIRSSLPVLFGMSGMFLLTTLGLGLFVSTLVKTQQQAMMVATFFVMLPFALLSGFAFPVENMPVIMQPLAQIIPLTHYLKIIRGIFLKGTGWAEMWPQAAILAGWGIGILALAVARFHKRLD